MKNQAKIIGLTLAAIFCLLQASSQAYADAKGAAVARDTSGPSHGGGTPKSK